MTKSIALLFAILGIQLFTVAQVPELEGQIIDAETNGMVPNVTIQYQNKKAHTLSNGDGSFRLPFFAGEYVEVSHAGYIAQRILVRNNQQQLRVLLERDHEQLSEVIVTSALGLKRAAREQATSTKEIKSTALNQARPVNPILGLASKVAGLRINMFDSKVDPDVQVNLRGIRSHSGDNSPLFVVDGVPVPAINRLNPNDIESINVLKGANAAALYGSEGVNGVLIITTRKGKSGNQQIRYSNTTLFESVMRLPDQQTTFGNGLNGIYNPTQYQSWGPAYDGSIKPIGSVLPDGSQWELPYAAIADARKDFFNTGINSQHDLSLSGGDAVSTYFISLQHANTKGIIEGDQNRRTGARFNASRKFGKLKTSFNINYVFNKNDVTPSEPWSTVYRHPAHIPFSSLQNWEQLPEANPNYWYSTNQPNPYFNAANQRNLTRQQTLNASLQVEYPVTSWFDIIYRAGLYNRNESFRNTIGKFSYTTAGRTNIPGSVNDGTSQFSRLNNDVMLNFHKKTGRFQHRLLVGNNLRADDTKSINLSAAALVVPDLYNQDNRTGQLNGASTVTQYRQTAIYGEYTTGFDDFLFLTFTGRNEWVSVLNPENRSYFYPGAGLSFVFSEAFPSLRQNRYISYGKLYTSYNRTGNVSGIAPYALNNTYSQTNGFPFGTLPGFSLGTNYPNFNMRPEFVRSFEIGTQLGFFNNRLKTEITYARSVSSDGIVQTEIPGSTGYASALVNAFKVQNDIIELDISGDLIRSKKIRWNLGATLYYMKNEVKEIYGELDRLYTFRQNYVIVGQPYNTFMFRDYRRDDEGRIIVDATTGNPVGTNELYIAGTGTPPWQIGLNTSLDYGRFHLGAQFDWRMGAIVYSEAANRMISDGTSPLTVKYNREPFIIPNSSIQTADGKYETNTTVYTAGDRNYWANFVAPVQVNYAVPADFVKLRELQLAYSLPEKMLGKQRVAKEASIALIGRNLFSIWHKDNIYNDPEFVYAGGSSEGYLSWRHLPATRMIGFSVSIGF